MKKDADLTKDSDEHGPKSKKPKKGDAAKSSEKGTPQAASAAAAAGENEDENREKKEGDQAESGRGVQTRASKELPKDNGHRGNVSQGSSAQTDFPSRPRRAPPGCRPRTAGQPKSQLSLRMRSETQQAKHRRDGLGRPCTARTWPGSSRGAPGTRPGAPGPG